MPESNLYLLPSVNDFTVMPKGRFEELIEDNIIDKHDAFDENAISLYSLIFKDTVNALRLKISDNSLVCTVNFEDEHALVTVINCSAI